MVNRVAHLLASPKPLRFLVGCVILLSGSLANADDYRLWRDVTGSFSVKAKLLNKDDKNAQLSTEAGKIISVPLAKLSVADRQYLKALAGAKPSTGGTATVEGEAQATAPKEIQKLIQLGLNGPPIAPTSDDTLASFFNRLEFPVYLDTRALNAIGLNRNEKIEVKPGAATLGDQLQGILSPLKLAWQVRQTVVVVGRHERRRPLSQTVVYSTKTNASAIGTRLSRIEPDSWMSMGGPGTFMVAGTYLVVRQSSHVHHLIERELKLRPLPARYSHALDQVSVSLEAQQIPLTKLAEQLGSQLGRPIQFDHSSLNDLGLSPDVPVSASFKASSARDVLDLVLAAFDCTWVEDGTKITITSMMAAEQMPESQRITLRIDGVPGGDNDSIMQLVQTTVAPSSWAALGGPGKMLPAGGGNFTITQSQPVLRELMDLAATLNRR